MSKLREARQDKHLTQQQVADIAGIRANWYHMIEAGQRSVPPGIAAIIAGILDKDIDSLFQCGSYRVRADDVSHA